VLERPLPPDPAGATHAIGIVEVFLGILTTVGSLALAAALLGAGGLKRPIWDPAPRVGRGALLRLRRLHSGQIGDYVAWLVLGFAVLSGALVATV
jgi:multicomponent Na+:H+ antiporter subunit D